ncbi:MAG: protein kinase [Candidatus Scalindua sp.]|jgi:tetratricopeptide (TPR) repeat protein|nr:protein kinase [Candidatus Scalindua sp.]MBT6053697.1 protein kinase [Candidatus Scalindua sp.]MBT6229264.1 protein kinase [Candidatus Scalindua sp.]MBT6565101.1 protein kinase [Candidatus Scalindua sp.]MBT7210971.1 protein kinase [Candidatus Scalindua sp.]
MPKINRFHPKNNEIISLNNLAVECYNNKELEKAQNICLKIYKLDPEPDMLRQHIDLGIQNMRFHMILSEIYYKSANYPEAIKILNRLKALGKHFSDKHVLLAKIYLKKKDYTKALQEYEEMTIECPQRFKSILTGLLDIINLDPFIERSYELLHNLYKKRGKEDSLISDFKCKVANDKYNRPCLLGTLEQLYYLLGQNAQAIPLLIQHQKRYPNDAKPYYLLGNIYLESSKYSEAIIQYNQVVKLDPSRRKNIISSIERVPNHKDADDDIINYLVNLYIDENKLTRAVKILDHLLETKPTIVDYQNKMEQVLLKVIKNSLLNNLLEFSISMIEKLIRLRPENIKYRDKLQEVQKLNIHNKIPEYEKKLSSIELHDNVTGAIKDDVKIFYNELGDVNRIRFDLAMFYISAGTNEERAISLLQKVSKSNSSKKGEALLQVGLHFLAKDYNGIAYDNFNNILTLNVPDKEKLQYLYKVAIACEKKNLHNKAKFFYGKVLAIDLQYKDISKRMERISVLTNSAASEALLTNINQKFENIEKIGEGNIWVFYKAVDKLLKRKVVITIIKEDFRYNPEAIDRFIMETQSLSKTQHNGIVKVHDVNIDILLYIVMEHIDGESLRAIKKKRSLSLKEVLTITIDICDAIKCAHKHGVIHRDIRPDNIRLTSDNTVKISAFGLSHIMKTPWSINTDHTVETPFYKSPEQIREIDEKIDERSDIYSLGITLYELLMGHLPFHEGDIADQQLNELPKSLCEENPEIPKWLDKMVRKCLEKDPSDRYQEMGRLQKELESYSKFYIN